MVPVINMFVAVVDAVVAVPVGIVATEIAAALVGRVPTQTPAGSSASGGASPAGRPALAVLVPAHDEHDTIQASVVGLLAHLRPDDRLVVVADNCTDDTAALARAAIGADGRGEVIERHDAARRGKGFALDYGVRHLAATSVDGETGACGPALRPRVGVVVIVDADVRLSPGSLDALAAQAAATGRPAQGVYLLRQAAGAPANPVSMLAFKVRNLVRPLGLRRLGGPCPLFGAGMAFPWAIIEKAPLASPHLTEDVALALDLACVGRAPRLCPDALIEGDSAPSDAASEKQRKRWEHGHLSLILSAAPRTLVRGMLRGSVQAVVLALDVMVPPLSLLVMLCVGATGLTVLLALVGWVGAGLAVWQAGVLGVLVLALMVAAVRFGPPGRRTGQLVDCVRYAAGKLPLYAGFVVKRQKSWERTDRTATTPGEHAA